MTDSVDIRSLPGAGVYQLCLPDQVATRLHLTEADGNALFITHENKMQLEWLGQRIWEQYHLLLSSFTASKARLKKKKRTGVIVLLLAALVAVFSAAISTLTGLPLLYIRLFAFMAGVVCCLQLLKYFARGTALPEGDRLPGLEISELRASILKDFSPTD